MKTTQKKHPCERYVEKKFFWTTYNGLEEPHKWAYKNNDARKCKICDLKQVRVIDEYGDPVFEDYEDFYIAPHGHKDDTV